VWKALDIKSDPPREVNGSTTLTLILTLTQLTIAIDSFLAREHASHTRARTHIFTHTHTHTHTLTHTHTHTHTRTHTHTHTHTLRLPSKP
jgi:hypothetical protein